MADGIDYNSVIKLAELKIKDKEKYDQLMKAIHEVSLDMIKITYNVIQEIQKK